MNGHSKIFTLLCMGLFFLPGYALAECSEVDSFKAFFKSPILSGVKSSLLSLKKCRNYSDNLDVIKAEANGPRLIYFNGSLSPSRVKRGRKVTFKMCYGVIPYNKKSMPVKEEREIWTVCGNRKTLLDTVSRVINREEGVWESKLEFVISKKWDIGNYFVVQKVSSGDMEREEKYLFRVTKSRNLIGETKND